MVQKFQDIIEHIQENKIFMGLEKVGTKFITAWVKAGEKSLLATRPVKINIKQPLIYKPKYEHEFKKILDTFDKELPLQYRQAVTRHKEF